MALKQWRHHVCGDTITGMTVDVGLLMTPLVSCPIQRTDALAILSRHLLCVSLGVLRW